MRPPHYARGRIPNAKTRLMIQDLIDLANDNLIMEPLTALHTACSMMGANIIAPRATQDDDYDLFRSVELDGKEWLLSFNGEQWETGWI